jgi:SAM-dependent methyltransferase
MKNNSHPTSWQPVASWYNKITGEGGHYYHQHVVIPGVLKLLSLKSDSKLLDVACGNGVLGKAIPKDVEYVGVDIAESLISEAKRSDKNPKHKYLVGDVTSPLSISSNFTHASIVLALQNIKDPIKVLKDLSNHLAVSSKLVLVLNHPAFRIPRQSSWGIDVNTKMQYRRVDRYMTPMDIPITAHPGERFSPNTLSYHFPISDYSKMLKDAGFVIDVIEEWTSDKESVGRNSKMENRARNEFPLFMVIVAIKR